MAELRIPEWTLGDRLRKAREDADIDIQDMARRLGYHRNTITAYEADDRPPKAGLVRAWADICAVSLEWLADGVVDLSDQPARNLDWNAVEQLDLFSSEPLAADRFGRVIRLRQVDVDAFIESCRVEAGSLASLYPPPLRAALEAR